MHLFYLTFLFLNVCYYTLVSHTICHGQQNFFVNIWIKKKLILPQPPDTHTHKSTTISWDHDARRYIKVPIPPSRYNYWQCNSCLKNKGATHNVIGQLLCPKATPVITATRIWNLIASATVECRPVLIVVHSTAFELKKTTTTKQMCHKELCPVR